MYYYYSLLDRTVYVKLFNKIKINNNNNSGWNNICSVKSMDIVGPDLGLHVNLQKCELFGKDKSMFISTIPYSNIPHFEILGAPVGDAKFCNKFIIKEHFAACALLSSLE